ncbi:hypothetical protein A2U01_0108534, partial [Trifolium medium]|nr:hypothetical protein [Trifolium medium]
TAIGEVSVILVTFMVAEN